MNTIHETDVLIVGGGPAGASAALSLLTHSNTRVILVEQSDLNRLRVGEHVSASIFKLIEYLKLDRDDFGAGSFRPSFGDTSYWGNEQGRSRDSIFTTEASSYQLDREQFDLTLIEEVAQRGGVIFPRTKCTQFNQSENKDWEVKMKHPDQGTFTVQAKFLVDATGRQANVCRQINVSSKKYDQLVGVGTFLKFKDTPRLQQQQITETCELGWWYAATLPNNTFNVTLFSDADIISKHQLNKSTNWQQQFLKTQHIKKELQGLEAYSERAHPWVRNAFTQVSDSTAATNFLAIGDAAASFDPVSSMGIGFAMSSALQAANIIIAILSGEEEDLIAIYQQDITKNFEKYLQLRTHFYQKETRWAEADFWSRRS